MKIENLLAPLSHPSEDEVFQELLRGVGHPFKLEQIVSTGQTTAEGTWCDQETDEWVLLLSGAARLRFEDEDLLVAMGPGDCGSHNTCRSSARPRVKHSKWPSS